MNCLEFRREKLADPRRVTDAARAHALGCARCAALAREVDAGDARIEQALSVPVPEGLAERVLLRQGGAHRPAWRAWAIAASLAVAAAAGVLLLNAPAEDRYARFAIDHVAHEPESFTTRYHAEPASFESALRSLGGSARTPLGTVRYVRLCPWEGGGTAWHVVIETPEGLATLILVPQGRVDARSSATVNGWNALVEPVAGGFYAVVTSSAAATSRINNLMSERVAWRS